MKLPLLIRSIACILLFFTVGTALFPEPVAAAPLISISPKSGAPGTIVTVEGSNFSSYVGDLLIVYFDETELDGVQVSVPSSGDFELNFQVPDGAQPGDATVSIRDVAGIPLAQTIFIIPTPEVWLDVWGGEVLTEVRASVRGFHSGTPVYLKYYYGDKIISLGSQTTGLTGECILQFSIPESPRGSHSIIASNNEGQWAVAQFGVMPSVTLEPRIVTVGDTVTVTGTGFNAKSQVIISLYNIEIGFVDTTASGSFDTSFVLPVIKAGNYLVVFTDSDREVRWAEITVATRISLSRLEGEVGARLTLSGTGFEVESIVSISYNGDELYRVRTDNRGAFTFIFTVPISTAGEHTITVTDGANRRQIVYTVEADPPNAPEPRSPKDKAVVTIPVTFDWEGVYDISQPLHYTIQISHTEDFNEPVLEKIGLIDSHYTMGKNETLLPNRRGTYYHWRVRATDGASNVGEWSSPVVFRVKPVDIMPDWARQVLIAAQVIITLLFVYRIWRSVKNIKSGTG